MELLPTRIETAKPSLLTLGHWLARGYGCIIFLRAAGPLAALNNLLDGAGWAKIPFFLAAKVPLGPFHQKFLTTLGIALIPLRTRNGSFLLGRTMGGGAYF